MANDAFVLTLAISLALLFLWGFRTLPEEQWQVMATVPTRKSGDAWHGLNLTYYGLLMASSTAFASAIALVLLGAIGVPTAATAIVASCVLSVCVPAARVLARLVERKHATFTVGGASFLGIVLAPAIVAGFEAFAPPWAGTVPALPTLAAMAIAYAFGEGAGRLACISFGCCYGRPLARTHPIYRAAFGKLQFTFTGHSKKAAYEGGLERQPLVPIQAITAVIDAAAGIVGLWLFLRGAMLAGFLAAALTTQVWRAISETLRADYRGGRRFSWYQVMAVIGALYAAGIALLLPGSPPVDADIRGGLRVLWSPAVILMLQALWLGMFLYTGRSIVTAARISIYVVKERI